MLDSSADEDRKDKWFFGVFTLILTHKDQTLRSLAKKCICSGHAAN